MCEYRNRMSTRTYDHWSPSKPTAYDVYQQNGSYAWFHSAVIIFSLSWIHCVTVWAPAVFFLLWSGCSPCVHAHSCGSSLKPAPASHPVHENCYEVKDKGFSHLTKPDSEFWRSEDRSRLPDLGVIYFLFCLFWGVSCQHTVIACGWDLDQGWQDNDK